MTEKKQNTKEKKQKKKKQDQAVIDLSKMRNTLVNQSTPDRIVSFLSESIKRMRIYETEAMKNEIWKLEQKALDFRIEGLMSIEEARLKLTNKLAFDQFKKEFYKFMKRCLRVFNEAQHQYKQDLREEFQSHLSGDQFIDVIKAIGEAGGQINAHPNMLAGLQNKVNELGSHTLNLTEEQQKKANKVLNFQMKQEKRKKKNNKNAWEA